MSKLSNIAFVFGMLLSTSCERHYGDNRHYSNKSDLRNDVGIQVNGVPMDDMQIAAPILIFPEKPTFISKPQIELLTTKPWLFDRIELDGNALQLRDTTGVRYVRDDDLLIFHSDGKLTQSTLYQGPRCGNGLLYLEEDSYWKVNKQQDGITVYLHGGSLTENTFRKKFEYKFYAVSRSEVVLYKTKTILNNASGFN